MQRLCAANRSSIALLIAGSGLAPSHRVDIPRRFRLV